MRNCKSLIPVLVSAALFCRYSPYAENKVAYEILFKKFNTGCQHETG